MSNQYQNRLVVINLVAVIICLLLVSVSVFLGSTSILLCSASMAPMILVLVYIHLSKQTEIFNPISFLLLNLVFGVFLQTVYFTYFDYDGHPFGLSRMSSETSLFVGIAYITLSAFGFIIGYSIRSNKKYKKRQAEQYSLKRLKFACVVLATVSVVSSIVFILRFDIASDFVNSFSVKRRTYNDDGVIQTGGYLRFLSGLSLISFAFLYVIYKKVASFRVVSPVGMLMILTALLSIAFPIITSARSGLLQFLITFATLNHFLGNGWRLGVILRYFGITLLLLLALSVTRYVQQSGTSYANFQQGVVLEYALGTVAGSNNLLSVGKTSVLIASVPDDIDYYYGETFLYWLVAPIPRSLWSGKPNVKIGSLLGPTIFGSGPYSGVPPGIVGELYLNLSWVGIFLGMLLIGFLLRKYYDNFGLLAPSSTSHLVIYALTIPLVGVFVFGGDFTGFVSNLLQLLVPVVLVNKYALYSEPA